jgi:biopolymer transport protein ExbD
MNIKLGRASSEPEVMTEMNMTPLIDVMLVLIIMLIITIPIQNHAVNLSMPKGTPPPPLVLPVVINIDIGFDGMISWNGELVDYAGLESKLRAIASMPDQPEVHLHPDKRVAYRAVASVMAAAQRHGVVKIGIVNQ